jgi:hypothetical protein
MPKKKTFKPIEVLPPLETMLLGVESAVSENDHAQALKSAKAAAPYMGLTAQQIIDAIAGGKSANQMYSELQEKLRRAGIDRES